MPSFSYNLITVSGKFYFNNPLIRTELWSISNENLQEKFPGGKRIKNFIIFECDCGIICQVYTHGSFKIVLRKKNCIDLISNLKNMISSIRTQHANLLFQNKLISSKFRISQVQMSVQSIGNTNLKLSYEVLAEYFPKKYFIRNKIKIPFRNSYFVLPINHAQHESGSSHVDFKIYINGKRIASCKVFNTFNSTVILKYTSYIHEIFRLVSEFCQFLHLICSTI